MNKLTMSKNGKYVLNHTSVNKVVDEVGKLEETTGASIEIITELFKRMINGSCICVKKANYIEDIYGIVIDVFINKENKLELGFINLNDVYRLKDYGKTWAFKEKDIEREWN